MSRPTGRPTADDGNGNDDQGTLDRRTRLKSSSGKQHDGNRGAFQKASIDEAYLEPSRRTLLAELRLSSSQREKNGPSAAPGCSTSSTNTAAPEPLLVGAKRARGGENSEVGGRPSMFVQPSVQHVRRRDDSCGRGPSRSQDGDESGEGNRWNLWAEWSPDDDGQPNEWARRRSPRTGEDEEEEEEEEARLLKAGDLLATRIQQTLSDVLQYDCSIGVASNKARRFPVHYRVACHIKDKSGRLQCPSHVMTFFGLADEPLFLPSTPTVSCRLSPRSTLLVAFVLRRFKHLVPN